MSIATKFMIKKQSNVFIVDDNKIFALALKAYIENAFENSFFSIYLFETGEKCLEKMMLLKPELVILDFHLNSVSPNAADGLMVLDNIKLINRETTVIMLTSDHNIDTVLASFHHGAVDYIVKTENQFNKIHHSITNIFTNKELNLKKEEKDKRDLALIIANKERGVRIVEKEKYATALLHANIQKETIEKSKFLVEEKNRDITDSINYAKRIQQAKLPRKKDIDASLPLSFILFKPKDIVSGDFYWFKSLPLTPSEGEENSSPSADGRLGGAVVLIAAADCTGHGVPGALMSMIGSEKLDEAVHLSTDTSKILNHLNSRVKKSLHQSDSEDSTRDGMDIALCSIEFPSLLETNRVINLKYAGANRPIWIIRKGQSIIEEIKGTKKSIGGFTADNQHFDSHELKLQQGDTFYLSSDGFADQFGGSKGKKIMTKNFKEILLSIQDKTMKEQKKHLDNFVENWRSEAEQVDDILVIGVRV